MNSMFEHEYEIPLMQIKQPNQSNKHLLCIRKKVQVL